MQIQIAFNFFGVLPTCLALLFMLQKHNPYKLYINAKVSNKALQQSIIQHQLVLLKGPKGQACVMLTL